MIRTSHFGLSSLVLAVGIAIAPLAFAQSTTSSDTHHSTTPAAQAPAVNMPSGMGMMGQGGASMNDMTQMMTMMRSMMPMMGAASNMMSSHVEDRIAQLKEELKVTNAQLPRWTAFADAMRGASHSMNGMYQQMMQQGAGSLPKRLDAHEKLMAQHLTSLRTLKEAAAALYPTLTDDQKSKLDSVMVGPMGMM
jgi:hypothetical protein